MFERVKKMFTKKRAARSGRRVAHRQSYDAASVSDQAARDWAKVDNLGINSSASPTVRATIRKRGRHEMLNNPYMDGIIQTFSGDIIGPSPRLRVRTGVREINTLIEREFSAWMKRVRLSSMLRLAVETYVSQGEVFGKLFSNPKSKAPVKLDIMMIEPDQVATPHLFGRGINQQLLDGAEYDRWGNVLFYHVLHQHPSDKVFPLEGEKFDRIPAEEMFHLFKVRRPGQRRGLPRIMSSLSLFPQLRSFRQSVLTAAQVAAQLGAVLLETELDVNETDDPDDIDVGTTLEIDHGMMTALPRGMKANQMDPKQPSTTFNEFNTTLVAESARPLGMPRNIAMSDSSDYNYASGRLDHQTYDRAIDIDHTDIEDIVLDPILERWTEEALAIPGYLPFRTASLIKLGMNHSWMWKKRPHVDPAKETKGQDTRLRNGMATLGGELADQAEDFEDHSEELLREIEWYRSKGLKHPAEQDQKEESPLVPQDDTASQGNNGNGRAAKRRQASRISRLEFDE